MLEFLKESYWNIIPYDWRPGEIWYRLKCWVYHRYTTVKPRTLPYHTWCDRDKLLIHMNFEILSQFMEKELKGYRAEDWEYYYTEQPGSLIQFGDSKKDPYYVLDYLCRWWKFYLEKEDRLSDGWANFSQKHSKCDFNPIEGTQLFSWDTTWDSPENEAISNKIFKRYMKKSVVLERDLEDNLILLIKLRKHLWT